MTEKVVYERTAQRYRLEYYQVVENNWEDTFPETDGDAVLNTEPEGKWTLVEHFSSLPSAKAAAETWHSDKPVRIVDTEPDEPSEV